MSMHSSSLTTFSGRGVGVAPAAAVSAASSTGENQHITFTVGSEEYGINILAVREIRGWTPETKLPNLPHYVRGVINLRGAIIPIVDLRIRFGGGATDATKHHVVIVVLAGDGKMWGLLADTISDILAIPHDQVRPTPGIGRELSDDAYLTGLFTAHQRMVALLDINRLFSQAKSEFEAAGD
ncbi:putative chemotaxis protein CheW [Azospirillaceae bacterium]